MAQSYHFSLLLLFLACLVLVTVWSGRRPPSRTDRAHYHWRFHGATLWTVEVSHWRLADRSNKPFPLWSEPAFDDSTWETVDLTAGDTALDAVYGVSGIVPGWTNRGHAGYWGYAWYRIVVQVEAPAGKGLALEGPPGVDDGYQVFQNGILLGSFGNFSFSRPVVYNTQPMSFSLPQPGNGSTSRVLAFRVWMEPSTPANYPDVGGLRTAPDWVRQAR